MPNMQTLGFSNRKNIFVPKCELLGLTCLQLRNAQIQKEQKQLQTKY